MNREKGKENKAIDSFLFTPQPSASSTIEKKLQHKNKKVKKAIPLSFSPDVSDIPHNAIVDAIQSKEDFNVDIKINYKLQEERKKAKQVLQKRLSGHSSQYLQQYNTFLADSTATFSNNESTVNESDLINANTINKQEFQPHNKSTPRNSNVSPTTSSFDAERICHSLAEFSKHLENPEYSIQELCEKFGQLDGPSLGVLPDDSSNFVPGELANEKLLADELSWRKQKASLGLNTVTSDSLADMYNSKMSISDFFQGKSDNLSKLCQNSSPQKRHAPVPLVDDSVLSNKSEFFCDDSMANIPSISRIENALAADNTTDIINALLNSKKNSKKQKKVITQNNEMNLNEKENDHTQEISVSTRKSSIFKECNFTNENNSSDDKEDTKSINSLRVASSLSNLPSGKIPIESNRVELVWGCVKLAKTITKQFNLRNKSQSKLKLQICITGSSFKIIRDRYESDVVSSVSFLLHPLESRTFSILFNPSKIGAAVEKLNFYPIDSSLRSQQSRKQYLTLYGYGGHSQLEIQNVAKDTTGKMWLSLGVLDHGMTFKRQFIVRNTGTLPMFVCFSITTKEMYSFSNVTLSVTECLIKSGSHVEITVTYVPTKEDMKFLARGTKPEVLDIATIKITSGSEALRGRIQNIFKKLKNSGGYTDPFLHRLCTKFSNELLPNDLKQFKETVVSMKELLQELSTKEIVLTLERDADQTIVAHISAIDQSSIYHTLCQDVSCLNDTVLEAGGFKVEPDNLVLMPPTKMQDTILITNNSSTPMPFDIRTDAKETLELKPCSGVVKANDAFLVNVRCRQMQVLKQTIKIVIYLENDILEVFVKILPLKSSS